MTEKIKNFLCRLGNAVLLAGLIIFTIGTYYAVIKAGIPYQDAPLELQIQYTVHSGIGKELCKTGLFTLLYGIAFLLISRLLPKKHS